MFHEDNKGRKILLDNLELCLRHLFVSTQNGIVIDPIEGVIKKL